MPGLIIGGKEYPVVGDGGFGLEILNYKDEPRYKLRAGEDMRRRNTRWIRSIILHNTKNLKTRLKPGAGPDTGLARRITKLWSTDKRSAGAHLAIDWNGTIVCMADLLEDAAYHAGAVNDVSIGIELYEDSKGVVYHHQLAVCVRLVEWLCAHFGIQRQVHFNSRPVARLVWGGKDCVGVLGHCNCYAKKPNDPGQHVFDYLEEAGFVIHNFEEQEDRVFWRDIQRGLGIPADGIPGPQTRDALQAAGYKDGLWRPAEKRE